MDPQGACHQGSDSEHGSRHAGPRDGNFETIEEAMESAAAAIDSADVLDDAALLRGGLVPVRTFMRSKASANANRQKRKREKQRAAGMAPVSIIVPNDPGVRAAVRAAATAMATGALEPAMVMRLGEVLAAGGTRARLVRFLLRARSERPN